jgi:crossover junction endodeoxyribonuclease RusA
VITLPFPPANLNPNKRLHWAQLAKAKKVYRAACYILTKQSGAKVDWDGDIHAWIDFYPPDRRARDDDNIISAFKSGRDGMADALGINDKRIRIHPYFKTDIGGMVKIRLTKGD